MCQDTKVKRETQHYCVEQSHFCGVVSGKTILEDKSCGLTQIVCYGGKCRGNLTRWCLQSSCTLFILSRNFTLFLVMKELIQQVKPNMSSVYLSTVLQSTSAAPSGKVYSWASRFHQCIQDYSQLYLIKLQGNWVNTCPKLPFQGCLWAYCAEVTLDSTHPPLFSVQISIVEYIQKPPLEFSVFSF